MVALRLRKFVLVIGSLACTFLVLFTLLTPAPAVAILPDHDLPDEAPVSVSNLILASSSEANNQPWQQVTGPCPSLGGAVFSRVGEACGGAGTSFDVTEIFPPQVLRDSASPAAPCENGRTSGLCYRMWYVGTGPAPLQERRIGYAVSPDGIAWTRVPGNAGGGAVFAGSGVPGAFDQAGVSTMSIIRVGAIYRMYYTGFSDPYTIAGIGLAESADGSTWTRVPGPAGGGAVLRHSGDPAQFDTTYIVAPSVLLDRASPAAPCEGNRTSGLCYRMWYEGVRTSPSYRFSIGYALSPDGVNWTRVSTYGDGSIFGPGTFGTFDDNNVGVPFVMKDGAIYRMWYEANGYTAGYTTGYVVSTDGRDWVRPTPNQPVYTGASDTIVAGAPDEVWAVRGLKEGPRYRLYYATSTRPNSFRFGLAEMTPGTPLTGVSAERAGTLYTLRFTSGAVPEGGSVLITLPPEIDFSGVSAGTISGFGPGAMFSADPAAVTDAVAQGTARGALVVRLPGGAGAGEKSVSFTVTSAVPDGSAALIQVFNSREVIAYAEMALAGNGLAPTATATATVEPSPTATSTLPPTATGTAGPSPGPTSTVAPTSTATPTATPAAGSNFALAFAGGDDQAQSGPIPGLGGTQTAELWVRPATTNQTSIVAGTSNGDNGWSLELENGRVVWWLFAGGQWRVVTHPTVLAANTWYHVTVTYDAATGAARVFVNGVAGTAGTVGALTTGTTFSLGGLSGYPFFNGQLDEVRLSNNVRYTASFAPPTTAFAPDANTIAIFSLDEGAGQTTADRSGNGYVLTLGTSAAVDAADPAWVASTAPIN